MNFAVLSTIGGILKPFAWFFGIIFNGIFNLLSMISSSGYASIAITLVIFTIIVKMLMLPLTVRQQKFAKLSSKMQPELTAIQEKYKGKKDETSMRLQQMESQQVYEKYGSNPTSGCLPLLITLPIIWAMYRVIYAIPAYVKKIGDLYYIVANKIITQDGYVDYLKNVVTGLSNRQGLPKEITSSITNTQIVDILTKFGTNEWNDLLAQFPALNTVEINNSITSINHIFSIGDFNILNSPSFYAAQNGFFNLALLVPILAIVTQLGSSILSKVQNKQPGRQNNNDNPMAQSMNSMLYVMPFMSGFFCYSFPLCIGIYWIINTVVAVIQQIFINIHINHMDLDEMIAKNVEKQEKKKEKLGMTQGSTMANLSKMQTKNLASYQPTEAPKTASSYAKMSNASKKDSSSADVKDVKDVKVEVKSVSGYANMLKK